MANAAHARMHGWLAVGWLALTLGTTVLAVIFPEHPWLLAWVIFMSGYALTVSHWAAREAADDGEGD